MTDAGRRTLGSDLGGRHIAPSTAAHLRYLIHDDLLQMLALAMLQAELSQRLRESGRVEEAFAELDGLLDHLESVSDGLRHVMADLGAPDEGCTRG